METILNCSNALPPVKNNKLVTFRKLLCGVLLLTTAVGLPACGSKEKKAGQTLARVNGEEITILQINDELRRADVQADQQEAATKQLLESLIDRQLITEEAMRNKIHRTPEVVQAIERAKANIIEQAYLESIMNKIAKPTMDEINDYFLKHQEYFSQRKQYDIQQLIIATKDISDELKLFMDSANSLDAVSAWMDKHDIRYTRSQVSRNSTDLPEQMLAKLKEMPKGQLFMVHEGKNSLLNSISNTKDSPVTVKNAMPQIEQYLIIKKSKEAVDAEILHLRSLAKIEYLNAPKSPVQ
jgi:EpsD family peptidyl-prolyl cis-trans isomerase